MNSFSLKSIGFIMGVVAAFGCMAALIGIFGEQYFGMVAASVFVGFAVGGLAQRTLIKRFTPKANQND